MIRMELKPCIPSEIAKEISVYLNRPIYNSVILRNWGTEVIARLDVNNDDDIATLHHLSSGRQWPIKDRREVFDCLRQYIGIIWVVSISAVQLDGKEKVLFQRESSEGVLSIGACSWIMWTTLFE